MTKRLYMFPLVVGRRTKLTWRCGLIQYNAPIKWRIKRDLCRWLVVQTSCRHIRFSVSRRRPAALIFCSSSSRLANVFSKGFTKRPLLTSQENFGWDHKWILSMASGCMTRLYKQWSAYSGRWIPDVKEILDITEKTNEDRFARKNGSF